MVLSIESVRPNIQVRAVNRSKSPAPIAQPCPWYHKESRGFPSVVYKKNRIMLWYPSFPSFNSNEFNPNWLFITIEMKYPSNSSFPLGAPYLRHADFEIYGWLLNLLYPINASAHPSAVILSVDQVDQGPKGGQRSFVSVTNPDPPGLSTGKRSAWPPFCLPRCPQWTFVCADGVVRVFFF